MRESRFSAHGARGVKEVWTGISSIMRPWMWPVLTSVVVVLACGAWEADVQSHITGPEHSVDFQPLVPIVAGALALAVIWFVAAVVWVVRLWRKYPSLDPVGVRLVDGERE